MLDGSTANLPLSYMLSDHIRQVIEDSGIGLEFAPYVTSALHLMRQDDWKTFDGPGASLKKRLLNFHIINRCFEL